jgi:hypothetical protein
MTRRAFFTFVLAAVAVLAFFAQPVLAQTQTSAEFDAATQTIKFSISNAADTTYDIHITKTGCVAEPEETVYLMGPEDSGSTALVCIDTSAAGQVTLAFCRGLNCFETRIINVVCNEDCEIYTPGAIPALSKWGMLVLLLLIVSTAVWMLRRKRVTA